MLSKNLENPIIAVSVRVYQALLVAYPTKFQQEYGPHMLQVFRDCCLRTFHQSGTNGMARLWAITLFDLVQSLVSEHAQKETFMTRSKFIRLGGWSLMLGAVTLFIFFLGITVDENVRPFRWVQAFTGFSYLMYIWAAPVLLGLGMLGLRTRYGDEVGSLGKNILLLGAMSGFPITLIGMFTAESTEWGWLLLFGGNAFLLLCLAIFGFLALRSKLFPRWNYLPIWAGLPFPLLMAISITVDAITGNELPKALNLVLISVVMLQCIALLMLGYILQSDVPEDVAATA